MLIARFFLEFEMIKQNIEVIDFDLTENKNRPSLLIDEEVLSKVTCETGDISNTENVLSVLNRTSHI